MSQTKCNTSTLPMKLSFFFYLGGMAPLVIFIPTIARQLGYSMATYGTAMTCATLISMIGSPIIGRIVDKYPVKKLFFLTAALACGICGFLIMFVPKLPYETNSELVCGNETYLKVFSKTNEQSSCEDNTFLNPKTDEVIHCKLNCQKNPFEGCNNCTREKDTIDYLSITTEDNRLIDISTQVHFSEHVENIYKFQVLTAQIDDIPISSLSCQNSVKTSCQLNCSDNFVAELASSPAFEGSVYKLYQFWWLLQSLIILFFFSQSTGMLQNAICLDLLGDKHEDFGKNKCWSSVGWGISSIASGWLVDYFSPDPKNKNYTPVFGISLLSAICHFIVAQKIKIVETTVSKDWKPKVQHTIYGLFRKGYVVSFFVWMVVMQFFHSIIIHFLFWYLDEMVDHDCSKRQWIKTLQGITQGVQCFGGELPFYFWAGWIIQKLGYLNCMALSLGVMSVRMFLYSVISNPAWVILIEVSNGISYALAVATKMSYAKLICPPNELNSLVGFVGFVIVGGDSLGSFIGGFVYEAYGGAGMFKYCSYVSGFMCLLQVLCNIFGVSKELKNKDFTPVSTQNAIDAKL
ncbi:uncharacterized protein LOC126847359 [Adelges cooleyi]|uniref:uncharacterized protein LOC126847359 n=1 Tax=Adelges cooleyi TaxID=133065 RepID=UPI002180270C|nr:uncharacterized protein LOC126847359 [Adelges cooleyi]